MSYLAAKFGRGQPMLRRGGSLSTAPSTEAPDRLLDRVRKLLAKAEAEGVTVEEARH